MLILGLLSAGLLLASPPAEAISFDFTSDHCTGGCGTAPFGTVTLTQTGTTVDVTVHLNAGYQYVTTGSGAGQVFLFDANGVVPGDITINAHLPQTLAASNDSDPGTPGLQPFHADGTGDWQFGIACTNCAQGGAGAFTGDIVFHVANAVIADFVANADGNLFVTDVLAPNGNTGPIDVTGPGAPVPEPATLFLVGSGLVGVAAWRRKRFLGGATQSS